MACISRLCAGRHRRAIDVFLHSEVAVCPSETEIGKDERYFSYSRLMKLLQNERIPWAVKVVAIELLQVNVLRSCPGSFRTH